MKFSPSRLDGAALVSVSETLTRNACFFVALYNFYDASECLRFKLGFKNASTMSENELAGYPFAQGRGP